MIRSCIILSLVIILIERTQTVQHNPINLNYLKNIKELNITEPDGAELEKQNLKENQESLNKELPLKDKLEHADKKNIKCSLTSETLEEIEGYKGIVEKIIKYVLQGEFKGKVFDLLAELTDNFGHRMTGSKQLEDSIEWILEKSKEELLENIHTESFRAPHWVRNNESLLLIHPRRHKLNFLGLGSSVGTSSDGILAKIYVVKTFSELEKNADKARGNIVVFNPTWTSYSDMVIYRLHGASRAAKVGALASLISSVTPFSIYTPHTGWQIYDDATHKIPTASITKEDAEMFQRFQDRGETVQVHLFMGAQNFPEVVTRNIVSEMVGRESPDDVVVVSGHLDSWDVGTGAMDDGGGSIISWFVPVILKKLDLKPRRTIRTVLFSGEEQGLHGGKAYFKKHSMGKEKFQILLESDSGTFNPAGLSFSGNNEAQCILSKVLSLLEPLNTTKLSIPMSGGPDIIMWEKAGVPTGSLLNSNDNYFYFHHSAGDTMTVEDSSSLDKCAALWTAVAYILGDMNITLPR